MLDIAFWQDFEQFGSLIRFLIAVLVILIGWLISGGIGQLVVNLLGRIHFNKVLKRMGWEGALEKAEIRFDVSKFFGEIIKWFFVIVFLMISCEIVGLKEFSSFLGEVLAYLPNIIIAALIFITAAFLADFSCRVVVASAEKAKISYSKLMGAAVRWSIWVFAILAILLQVGITPDIIKAIVYGLIAMISLSCGLAFGLGGKELAAEILKDLKEKIS